MGAFQVGDRVVSRVEAQGMKRGEPFEVIARDERHWLGNVLATLTVRRLVAGRELRIVYGQLVLARAK
jgi:hypothetical protein